MKNKKQLTMTNEKISKEDDRIEANMQRHGWSTRWCSDSPQDKEHTSARYAERHCLSKSGVKPLLVIQYKDRLTSHQAQILDKNVMQVEDKTGYNCLIVDSMDEAKVQVFGVDAQGMDTLTLDQLIDMLEALKRVRQDSSGIGGSIAKS